MTESFSQRDLKGATFSWVDLTGATFELVYLRNVEMKQVDLTGLRVKGCVIDDAVISGEVNSLVVNGIDVVPLVEAELDRRHPERVHLRPTDADGFRAAWPIIEDLWASTVERARAMDPALLHQRVNGEWSFIQTLRHLCFATDSWVAGVLLGDASPWHPLDLPFDEMTPVEGVPWDRDAQPTLDEVLALRRSRMDLVAGVVATLTDEQLAGETTPVEGMPWPNPRAFPVQEVLSIIVNEEWWHRLFAERDLDALTS